MDNTEQKRVVFIIICGCLISILHRFYLANLFENEYRFSHLSSIEREITLKSEAAFYYSFYKELLLVEDGKWVEKWVERVGRLVTDECVEHQSITNDLQRFNLYPELVCSFLFNLWVGLLQRLNLPTRYCYHVEKGRERDVVESCEGIGDPMSFYLECVFTWNGLVLGVLFVSATYLSDSFLGGIISVMSFFFNHGEATRVGSTPPLRESFSFPLWLLHTFVTCCILRAVQVNKALLLLYASIIISMLVTWQLSPFTLLIHVSIIFILTLFGFISRKKAYTLTLANLVSIGFAYILQFFNPFLLASIYTCACVTILMYLCLFKNNPQRLSTNLVASVVFVVVTMAFKKVLMEWGLGMQDDNHVFHIFWSKIESLSSPLSLLLPSLKSALISSSSSSSFHTKLYTCAPEFDFIDSMTYKELTKTFLLPASLFVLFCVSGCLAIRVFDTKRWKSPFENRHLTALAYVSLSTTCYLLLATLVMRLKLFLVPLMCLLASIVAHPKFPIIACRPRFRVPLLIGLISVMSYQGVWNISMQSSVKGMMEDGSMEELVQWIGENKSNDSVFAGSMSAMASIHLLTHRCITNHPHYENQAMRNKTKLVYTIYSRKDVQEIWGNMRSIGADYVLLEKPWCFGASRVGCSLDDIWKDETKKEYGNNFSSRKSTEERKGDVLERFCENVFSGKDITFFSLVYKKSGYRLLKVL